MRATSSLALTGCRRRGGVGGRREWRVSRRRMLARVRAGSGGPLGAGGAPRRERESALPCPFRRPRLADEVAALETHARLEVLDVVARGEDDHWEARGLPQGAEAGEELEAGHLRHGLEAEVGAAGGGRVGTGRAGHGHGNRERLRWLGAVLFGSGGPSRSLPMPGRAGTLFCDSLPRAAGGRTRPRREGTGKRGKRMSDWSHGSSTGTHDVEQEHVRQDGLVDQEADRLRPAPAYVHLEVFGLQDLPRRFALDHIVVDS